jgi:outer membrane lipoprotein SlyB
MRRAVLISCIATAALAQPLDLRLPKTSTGEIRSIREVHGAAPRGGPGTAAVGTASAVGSSIPVGAVMYLPLGASTQDDRWRFGAVGTAELQERIGESTYEIAVRMDDGDERTLRRRDATRFHVGQRVSLTSGELEPL